MAWNPSPKVESPSLDWVKSRKAARRPLVAGPGAPAFALPDLIHLDQRLSLDPDQVEMLLELSYLGKEGAQGLDQCLSAPSDGSWQPELFAEDLFLDELVRSTFHVEIDGLRFPINHAFLLSTISSPPATVEAIGFRQEILRELEERSALLQECRSLYRRLSTLLDMFKAPDHAAQLDINAYRLDILRESKAVIDQMAEGFKTAESGLRRLHESGQSMQSASFYGLLCDLLDYEARRSTLTLSLNIGADGEIKDLRLLAMEENTENPLFQSMTRQWWLRLKAFFVGSNLSQKTIVQGVLHRVFEEVAPSLVSLVQIAAHLELYLASIGFRDRLRSAGLPSCLAQLGNGSKIHLEDLSNPLLLGEHLQPVPCRLALDDDAALTLVTGPNSGGKTRLLQSLGISQLLAQSGLYVPALHAQLPIVKGMFVSLVETETADQAEGRLGRELLRIRSLFAHVGSPSLVILDELCSGTNPTEGVEIFSLVLRLLERMKAGAFVSTHFLDFARELEHGRPLPRLQFLQVEPGEEASSTYQFIPGVAASSLAQETAQRLGVTFDQLSQLIDQQAPMDRQAAREVGAQPLLDPKHPG